MRIRELVPSREKSLLHKLFEAFHITTRIIDKYLRYRWLCERARAMGLDEEDDDEWEDLSGDEEIVEEDDRAEEVDEGIDGINTAECVIDGINQREIPLNECFFSGHISDSIEANLKHMETKFGFFIPW